MTKTRGLSAILAAVMTAGCLSFGLATPAAARRKNGREKAYQAGTYVGSAATVAALAKGKGTWALIGAGATALSYSQWRREMKKRHRDTSRASYEQYRREHARRTARRR